MNEITLKITGTKGDHNGETNEIELMTKGKHYTKNDCTFLVYEESELSGMEGSTTTLKIDNERVTMKRFGKNESQLIFEKSTSHNTIYQTIYGNLSMEVYTEDLEILKEKSKIKKLQISYNLSMGNNESKNTLCVDVL